MVDEPGQGRVIDDYPLPGESERHAGRDVDKLRPIRPEFFTHLEDHLKALARFSRNPAQSREQGIIYGVIRIWFRCKSSF